MPAEQQQDQISFLLSDFNARLRDTEEKNRILKERIILLGNNILNLKDQLDFNLETMKKDVNQMKKDLANIKSFIENIISETGKFVRKDEIVPVERMLKDFQPLEFARIKDLDSIINDKILSLKGNLKPEVRESSKTDNINQEIEKRISKLKEHLENEIREKLKEEKIKIVGEAKVPVSNNHQKHEEKVTNPLPELPKKEEAHYNESPKTEINKEEHKHIKDRIDHIMDRLNINKHTNKKPKNHKK